MQDQIQKLLLSWEEYNQLRLHAPYILTRQKDDQILIYFGAKHINDPEHEQYAELLKQWNVFIESSSGDRIAIGEGRNPRPIKETPEEAISLYGEQGYLRYLANQQHIEVCYPDPKETTYWEELSSTYSKDELFLHDSMQFAYQWNRGNKETSFPEYIEPALAAYRRESKWKDYDFSFDHMKQISPELIGRPFDEHDSSVFYDLTNPARFESRFNAISRDIDVFRDTAVVSEIVSQWQRGKSVFVVFGFSHAVVQERAIKELTK